ncbi:hypothetical protein MRX96_039819 [Rhipicephalus microplus]
MQRTQPARRNTCDVQTKGTLRLHVAASTDKDAFGWLPYAWRGSAFNGIVKSEQRREKEERRGRRLWAYRRRNAEAPAQTACDISCARIESESKRRTHPAAAAAW